MHLISCLFWQEGKKHLKNNCDWVTRVCQETTTTVSIAWEVSHFEIGPTMKNPTLSPVCICDSQLWNGAAVLDAAILNCQTQCFVTIYFFVFPDIFGSLPQATKFACRFGWQQLPNEHMPMSKWNVWWTGILSQTTSEPPHWPAIHQYSGVEDNSSAGFSLADSFVHEPKQKPSDGSEPNKIHECYVGWFYSGKEKTVTPGFSVTQCRSQRYPCGVWHGIFKWFPVTWITIQPAAVLTRARSQYACNSAFGWN